MPRRTRWSVSPLAAGEVTAVSSLSASLWPREAAPHTGNQPSGRGFRRHGCSKEPEEGFGYLGFTRFYRSPNHLIVNLVQVGTALNRVGERSAAALSLNRAEESSARGCSQWGHPKVCC